MKIEMKVIQTKYVTVNIWAKETFFFNRSSRCEKSIYSIAGGGGLGDLSPGHARVSIYLQKYEIVRVQQTF